jgi:emp24/gp25L/p24 family/GOLD
MQMTINQRTSECFYDILNQGYVWYQLRKCFFLCFSLQILNVLTSSVRCFVKSIIVSEYATMSIFILSGASLKATAEISGPLNEGHHIDSGTAMLEAANKWDHTGRHNDDMVDEKTLVDFEHLNIGPPVEGGDSSIELDNELLNAEKMNEDSEGADERRDRRVDARKRALEARELREAHKRRQRKKVREEGEPFETSIMALEGGWYRFCVVAHYNQVIVEIDLRKESEYGGIDKNGHVWTSQQKTLSEEENLIEQDTAESEGIKDEDFESTKEKLKSLRRLLAEIQSKQTQERHRLIVHSATNEHSHSRMVLSSLLETILFMVVTGFQVFTIRRWFKSAPVLGR